MVPVPEELVTDVMRYVTERVSSENSARSSVSARVVAGTETVTAGSREWTREELTVLRAGEAKSIKLFCQMLDILAKASPAAVSLDDVAKVTGVEPLTMQRTFGRATVWIQNRMGGDKRWPVYWPSDGWAMSENNASVWKSLVN